jgi:hypothetical protein
MRTLILVLGIILHHLSAFGSVTTIAYLRSLEDPLNYLPTDTNTLFTVEGIVTTYTNLTTATNTLFYIQDITAGVAVFVEDGNYIRPRAGDLVRVTAPLTAFSGLLELRINAGAPGESAVVLSSNNPLPAPTTLQFGWQNDPATMELQEGKYVLMAGVHLDTSTTSIFTVPGNATGVLVLATNASGELFNVRIDKRVGDIIGQPIPVGPVAVLGVLNQFDTTNPRTSGYQVTPTRYADITGVPIITGQPLSQTVQAGLSVTFTLVVSGTGALSYQWRFNGGIISGATIPTLTLNGVQGAAAGLYDAVVSNAFGSRTSAPAILTVLAPPPPPPPVQIVNRPVPASAALVMPSSTQLRVFKGSSFSSGGTIDTSKMCVIMTHGWVPIGTSPPIGADSWPTDMAAELARVPGLTNLANILAWDWRDGARDNFPPNTATGQTSREGDALAQALAQTLGPSYAHYLHFLGHSLGTLVNAQAVDYLHGDSPSHTVQIYPPSRTHVTLFDEAEIAEIAAGRTAPWVGSQALLVGPTLAFNHLITPALSPVPKHALWVDNYVSTVGYLHPDAANVILKWGMPTSLPDLGSVWPALADFHSYPCRWYTQTINSQTSSLMGHKWSFERNGLTSHPAINTAFLQDASSEFVLQGKGFSEAVSLAGIPVPANSGFEITTVVGTFKNAAVQSLGQVVDDVTAKAFEEPFPVVQLGPTFLDTAYSFSTTFSAYSLKFIIRGIGLPLRPGLTGLQGGAATNNPACVWVPVQIPTNTAYMAVEFAFTNVDANDYFVMGINDTNLFSLQSRFVPDATPINSGLVNVTAWAGQQVELFFGLMGGNSPNGSITVEGIQFYKPARPALNVQLSGSQLLLTWPIGSTNFILQTTSTLSASNVWSSANGVPWIVNLQNTVTNQINSNNSQFFRLRSVQ